MSASIWPFLLSLGRCTLDVLVLSVCGEYGGSLDFSLRISCALSFFISFSFRISCMLLPLSSFFLSVSYFCPFPSLCRRSSIIIASAPNEKCSVPPQVFLVLSNAPSAPPAVPHRTPLTCMKTFAPITPPAALSYTTPLPNTASRDTACPSGYLSTLTASSTSASLVADAFSTRWEVDGWVSERVETRTAARQALRQLRLSVGCSGVVSGSSKHHVLASSQWSFWRWPRSETPLIASFVSTSVAKLVGGGSRRAVIRKT